jgi:hypothetical protein
MVSPLIVAISTSPSEFLLHPYAQCETTAETSYNNGFWARMDTFYRSLPCTVLSQPIDKDKQYLDGLYAGGVDPWEVWKVNGNGKYETSQLSEAACVL